MAHDPLAPLKNNKYLDSISLKLPRSSGVVYGKEIPVEKGYYRILGKLTIIDTIVTVKLYYDNTDDHRKDESGWNGIYYIHR